MSSDPTRDRDELMRRVDELTKKVETLEKRLAPHRIDAEPEAPPGAMPAPGSRRDLLRLAVPAAAGAVAGSMLSSQPAAAATGDAMLLGYVQADANMTALIGGVIGSASPGPSLTTEATLMWIDNRLTPNTTGNGLRADGKGTNGLGVWGNSDSGGIGVYGNGGIGLAGSGGKAALRLQGTNAAPPTRSDSHVRGEIDIDSDGHVWLCVEAGTPGLWRRIGGPASAGAFHAVNPVRAYDSRWAGNARIASGQFLLVSVADGHDKSTGLVDAPDVVPDGATAVAYNLTVAGTLAAGFLFVAPGTATGITASSINWFGPGQTLANGSTVPIDTSRQVRVFAGGGGSTHFLIDIVGYYI